MICKEASTVSRMLWNIQCLTILAAILPGVFLQSYYRSNEGYIVTQCEMEAMKFAECEDQYIDKQNIYSKPSLEGPQDKDLQPRVYEIERLQRPFECITNRLNESSGNKLVTTPEYQNLMLRCKLEQPLTLCDPSYPYRTIDGTCNNLLNPKWGSSLTCTRRLLPARYEGVSGFRKSVCDIPLPGARPVSMRLFTDIDRRSRIFNNMFVFFGQALGHDLTDIPISNIKGQRIDCCSNLNHLHPQCAPILVSPDDPFYSKLNITCFNFIRTAPCPTCSLCKRNQMIQPTSFVDCSFVYGLSEKEARNLRRNDGSGKMLTQHREAGELLPPDYDLYYACGSQENNEYCFKAGDRRVSMHAPLSSLHTIFVTEHNRITEKLKQLNTHWDGETLYQEARKIVIAEMQVITYNEYLPLLLGSNFMSSYQLWTNKEGRSLYSPLVDSTLIVEFNTAAFRLHSMVSGIVTKFGADGKKTLTDFTVDASTIYHDQMGAMLKGICLSPSQKFGWHATKEISQNLYKGPDPFGYDLVAVDLQRGRDNGLPSYVDVLRYLSGGKINIQAFDDLNQVFDPENVELMKTVYCDPRDIDLFVGMNYERIENNMILSSSTAEIIAMQFGDLKFGDRFYFEHAGNFNDDQLRTLREASLAKLLCDNSKISSMQLYAMLFPSSSNPVKLCSEIPGINLDYWKA